MEEEDSVLDDGFEIMARKSAVSDTSCVMLGSAQDPSSPKKTAGKIEDSLKQNGKSMLGNYYMKQKTISSNQDPSTYNVSSKGGASFVNKNRFELKSKKSLEHAAEDSKKEQSAVFLLNVPGALSRSSVATIR